MTKSRNCLSCLLAILTKLTDNVRILLYYAYVVNSNYALCHDFVMVKPMELTLVLHNLRSCHNVGAILRTADAVGVVHVIAVGTTPYPEVPGDTRPPHVIRNNTKLIAKTALGAETTVAVSYNTNIKESLNALKNDGVTVVALELAPGAVDLFEYTPPVGPLALVLGPEVTGIPSDDLAVCDAVLAIPMHGTKESLNVSVAAGVAMYQLIRS